MCSARTDTSSSADYTQSRKDRSYRSSAFLFTQGHDSVLYVSVCLTEALQKERAEREEQWLQELDEEEYDALPEEEKERVVQLYRDKLRQKKLRYWPNSIFVSKSDSPNSLHMSSMSHFSLMNVTFVRFHR